MGLPLFFAHISRRCRLRGYLEIEVFRLQKTWYQGCPVGQRLKGERAPSRSRYSERLQARMVSSERSKLHCYSRSSDSDHCGWMFWSVVSWKFLVSYFFLAKAIVETIANTAKQKRKSFNEPSVPEVISMQIFSFFCVISSRHLQFFRFLIAFSLYFSGGWVTLMITQDWWN